MPVDSCHLGPYHCLVIGAGAGSASQNPASSLPSSEEPSWAVSRRLSRHPEFLELCGRSGPGWALGSGLLSGLTDTANVAEGEEGLREDWEAQGCVTVPFSAAIWSKFGIPVLWKSHQTGSQPAKPPLTSMPRCSIGPSLPVPSVLVPDEGGNKGQETSAPAEAIEPWGVVGNTLAPPENVGTEAALVPPPPSLSSFPLPMWPGQNLLHPGS